MVLNFYGYRECLISASSHAASSRITLSPFWAWLVSREEQSWDWEHLWESGRKFILLLFLVQLSPDAELLEICGHFWGRKLLFARDSDAVGVCVWAWSHEYRGFIWPWKEVHSMLLNENNNNNNIQNSRRSMNLVSQNLLWIHMCVYNYI